eukprot:TRINITY_DN11571_c0_g1_i1.p1 TRINITY_DN11571_c0_g1~~TRINITY_DN11571_c0_g1_i1.p1  ORF type:complete len:327 (+),score=74.16 TRINITY_DN11571_c0_g1_i1:112-1092(+)
MNLFSSAATKAKARVSRAAFSGLITDESQIVHSGYLMKRGKVNKALKRRWCVLQDRRLHYYKTQNNPHSEGYIPLDQAFVRPCAPGEEEEPFGFQVITPSRIFVVVARSKADMIEWVEILSLQTETCLENQLIEKAEETISQATEFNTNLEYDESVGIMTYPVYITLPQTSNSNTSITASSTTTSTTATPTSSTYTTDSTQLTPTGASTNTTPRRFGTLRRALHTMRDRDSAGGLYAYEDDAMGMGERYSPRTHERDGGGGSRSNILVTEQFFNSPTTTPTTTAPTTPTTKSAEERIRELIAGTYSPASTNLSTTTTNRDSASVSY